MNNVHPSREDFAGILWPRAGLKNPAALPVVRHLLRQCPTCLATLRSLSSLDLTGRKPGRSVPSSGSRAESYDYGAAFAKSEEALSSAFASVAPLDGPVERLLAELEEHPEDKRCGQVARDRRRLHPHFIEHLLASAHALRYRDPSRTLHYTDIARIAAEASTEALNGTPMRLADLRARAWSDYSNALRICGHPQEAEGALERAEVYRCQGTGDPLLRAHVVERTASLRIAQRRFDEAIDLANEAGGVYRELGERNLLASTMIQKAVAALYAGDQLLAVAVLNTAIPLIEKEENPHLLFVACHNLVQCYIDLGRPAEALAVFTEARDIYRDFSDPILVLRAGWHEGQILRDLGRLDEAEEVLLRVRDGFLERELPHETAIVLLDLAEIYVRQKDFGALRRVVAEAMPIFPAVGPTREIFASWLQLQQVAHEEQRALAVVRDLAKQLEATSKRSLAQAH